MLIDIQNSHTMRLSNNLIIKWSLDISYHLKSITIVLCEVLHTFFDSQWPISHFCYIQTIHIKTTEYTDTNSALTLLAGQQEGHPACKKLEWWGAGMIICLEQGADLHMTQLMPLPLTVSCFSKIQIGFTFLVPAMPSVLWHCWLGGRKGIRPVRNWAVGCWCGYLSGARCRLAYGLADATATHCLLLQ